MPVRLHCRLSGPPLSWGFWQFSSLQLVLGRFPRQCLHCMCLLPSRVSVGATAYDTLNTHVHNPEVCVWWGGVRAMQGGAGRCTIPSPPLRGDVLRLHHPCALLEDGPTRLRYQAGANSGTHCPMGFPNLPAPTHSVSLGLSPLYKRTAYKLLPEALPFEKPRLRHSLPSWKVK